MKRLLRNREVRTMAGLSNSQLYLLIQRGEFPAPIKLSQHGRSVAWLESDVIAWIDARLEASRATSTRGVAA